MSWIIFLAKVNLPFDFPGNPCVLAIFLFSPLVSYGVMAILFPLVNTKFQSLCYLASSFVYNKVYVMMASCYFAFFAVSVSAYDF